MISTGAILLASWVVTGVGFALFVMSWVGRADPIRRQRLSDCGMALIFGAVLARVIVDTDRNAIDWALGIVSPIFILAAIWRLSRTQEAAQDE